MTSSDPTPTVEVKPFHQPYLGMPDLYHTYCSACPDYGTCATRDAAESSARQHERWHVESAQTVDPRETEHIECDCVPELGPSHCHLCGERAGHPVPWSEAHRDGAPGDHDELLARFRYHFPAENLSPTATDVRDEVIAALRTEQSARQEAEKEMHSRELHHFESEELLAAAEERERVLIAGVKELAGLPLGNFGTLAYGYDGEQVDAILSRLLPSTPTEEGKSDE